MRNPKPGEVRPIENVKERHHGTNHGTAAVHVQLGTEEKRHEQGNQQEHIQGRQEPQGPANVERFDVYASGAVVFSQQQRGDEVSAENKEDQHTVGTAAETAWNNHGYKMGGDDGRYCQSPDSVQGRITSAWATPRTVCRLNVHNFSPCVRQDGDRRFPLIVLSLYPGGQRPFHPGTSLLPHCTMAPYRSAIWRNAKSSSGTIATLSPPKPVGQPHRVDRQHSEALRTT